MGLVKDAWHLLVLIGVIIYFGGLSAIVLKLGQSALDLQEHGMFSLGKYNRTLVEKSPHHLDSH